MFTLRFLNGADSRVVSGARYDVREILTPDQERSYAAVVTVYPGLVSDGSGVDFRVCSEDSSGAVCFVENAAGKTIDRIGPFEPVAQAA